MQNNITFGGNVYKLKLQNALEWQTLKFKDNGKLEGDEIEKCTGASNAFFDYVTFFRLVMVSQACLIIVCAFWYTWNI